MLTIFFTITLTFFLVEVHANIKPKIPYIEACLGLYQPQELTTSCCCQMDEFVDIIKRCIKENPHSNLFQCFPSTGELLTCNQAKCVTEKYGLHNKKGEISMIKARKLLKEQDCKGDLITKKQNELVLKYCINKNYKVFVSKDPQCSHWSYLNCAFFSYRLACNNIDNKNPKCRNICDKVEACTGNIDKYHKHLTSLHKDC